MGEKKIKKVKYLKSIRNQMRKYKISLTLKKKQPSSLSWYSLYYAYTHLTEVPQSCFSLRFQWKFQTSNMQLQTVLQALAFKIMSHLQR